MSDLASDFLSNGLVKIKGTVNLREKYRRRVSKKTSGGIKIPFDLEKGLLRIVFGPLMSESEKAKIRRMLEKRKIGVQCLDSKLKCRF